MPRCSIKETPLTRVGFFVAGTDSKYDTIYGMKLRLSLFFVASVTLALINALALEFSLYWRYLWLDMPMHFLGGFCVALGYGIIPFFGIRLPRCLETRGAYLGAVLLVGLAWELFEYVFGISLVNDAGNLISDTSMDLVLDLLGGYIGYLLLQKIK